MASQRINVLGVPVDILHPEDLEMTILELSSKPGVKQIVFLSVWGLLRARHRGEFQECVKNADLVIPVSKSILKGARFLKREIPVRYNPFQAVISIMSVMESHFKSLFLLGSHGQTLHTAEQNVHATFPHLQIVGRYHGYYQKAVEPDVIQAIYKSSPGLVLYCEGIKEKDVWAYNRRSQFSSSIFIYYKDALGIFSKRIKRVSEETFSKGHEIFHEILRNPLKIFLLVPFLHFILLLVWYRLLKK